MPPCVLMFASLDRNSTSLSSGSTEYEQNKHYARQMIDDCKLEHAEARTAIHK